VSLALDLFMQGRTGYNSVINGIWTPSDGVYTNAHLYMYPSLKAKNRFSISKQLNSTSNVYAYCDVRPGNKTPAGSSGWKVYNGKAFLQDDNVTVGFCDSSIAAAGVF